MTTKTHPVWPLAIVAVLLSALFASACSQTKEPQLVRSAGDGPVTTIYAVRHAEKEDGDDPSLTTRGQLRAQALAEMLGDDDIAAVFATEYLRTKQTVEPLARALGMEVEESPAGRPDELAKRILADFTGMAVVAAAHSNTVPRLLTALGVTETIELDDYEYGDLFVVVVAANGSVDFSRHRFGD